MQYSGALDVSIILDRANESWVLGKFAERLADELGVLGHKANRVPNYSDGNAINVWMYFNSIPLETIMKSPEKLHYAIVTHVNDFSKLSQLRRLLDLGVELIFLSENTYHLVSDSIRSGFQKNIIRLGSDIQNNRPRKIKVTMCSNIYADGRKNEKWVINLAKKVNPDHVIFRFVGKGWGPVKEKIESIGFEVQYFSQTELDGYKNTLDAIQWCDLYIYTGWDEGALGSLDAYIMGKALLISSQGFHSEFNLREGELFVSEKDFHAKFHQFQKKYFDGYGAIFRWTWSQSALDLIEILKKENVGSEHNKNRIRPSIFTSRQLFQTILKKLRHLVWKCRQKKRG